MVKVVNLTHLCHAETDISTKFAPSRTYMLQYRLYFVMVPKISQPLWGIYHLMLSACHLSTT